MALRTSTGIRGFVVSDPLLTHTLQRARLYFRFGQERPGSPAAEREYDYGDMVLFGSAAESAYEHLRKGDRFTAEGRVRTDETGRSQFIAGSIGVNGQNHHIRVLHSPAAARDAASADPPSAPERLASSATRE
ncbi:single-stranded DNA-binding protein [Microbacterium sp. No. 7]|uniref:single-stranded DNA-binding protein n=1 Tax=Microbacterium sp. No. 7 TaxID=1714373 RepID=UPI0006D22EF0|nr:single-stranded DNA-binding protein [Microbacterium sp. No. 7]